MTVPSVFRVVRPLFMTFSSRTASFVPRSLPMPRMSGITSRSSNGFARALSTRFVPPEERVDLLLHVHLEGDVLGRDTSDGLAADPDPDHVRIRGGVHAFALEAQQLALADGLGILRARHRLGLLRGP